MPQSKPANAPSASRDPTAHMRSLHRASGDLKSGAPSFRCRARAQGQAEFLRAVVLAQRLRR